MLASSHCHICEVATAERTILVLQPGQHVNDWPLCEACWRLLERGIRRTRSDGTVETVLTEFGGRLPEPLLLTLLATGLQTDGDSLATLQARLERERLRRYSEMDARPPWQPQEPPHMLPPTPYQREIARLIGDGLTNQAIAVRLGTTAGAVGTQIGQIVHRLGLTCRAEIATWVTEDALTTRVTGNR